ncbi:MAG: hypothetical protein ACK5JM_09280 [Rhodoblastus sp.]
MSQAEIVHPPRTQALCAGRFGVGLAIVTALACGVVLTLPLAQDVWTTGAFKDTDDAMRMVEVRDLLAGQGWYDMAAHRLAPPDGLFMHWSRVVDIPLALLMKTFGLFFAPPQAEAMTRLAFPLLMLAALYASIARVAGLFGGAGVQILAVALAFSTGPVFSQFVPGRIDHHAPQIVLLVLASGGVIAALDRFRAKSMWLAGACIALSLSISLENLPFFAVLIAVPVIGWIVCGARLGAAMGQLGLALAIALPLAFLATVGPQRWTNTACDAYSAAHLTAGLAGAFGLIALGALGGRFSRMSLRIAAAAVCGLAPLAVLALVAPACLGDPFVGLDPLVRAIWLDHVTEIQKLSDLAATQPNAAIMLGAPLTAALLATLATAVFLADGEQRGRLAALCALIAAGLVMTFWGVRTFSSIAPMASIGAASAVLALLQRLAPASALRPALAGLMCLPFAPMAYAIALPGDKPAEAARTAACLRPSAVVPLDRLPAGLVLAPIDAGAHILVFTHHSVIAAPYHRNNAGNRLSIDVFMAEPAAAAKIARASGADYLLACPAMARMQIMAERAPQGLAAALMAGRIPDWLEPLAIKAGPNTIYRIRR